MYIFHENCLIAARVHMITNEFLKKCSADLPLF